MTDQDDADAAKDAPDESEQRRRARTEPSGPPPSRTTTARARRVEPNDAPSSGPTAGGALRVLTIVAVVLLGLLGFGLPDSILLGGLAWLGFLLFAASGWGHIVSRVAGIAAPDLGLRAAWGIAGYLAVAGLLVALGVCSRPVLLILIGVGIAGFVWRELTTTIPSWQRVRAELRRAQEHPAIALLVVAIAGVALFQIVGAVAELDRNPWDDDIAYTPMIKRVLDSGDLIEPFSFRRLGAYGGQTLLGALAGARGTLASVHLIDKGLCFAITLLLLNGFARERKARALWAALIAVVVVVLPSTAINTASHWSGALLFVALYRTVARGQWPLVGLVGAAACTLRQNYLAVVVLFVGFVLLTRLLDARRETSWRDAWKVERRHWLVTGGVALAAILMWWVAAFVSSRTFLFPLVKGTWNHELSVTPGVMSWADELQYLLWSAIETTPLTIVPVLFIVLAFTRDSRAGRPLRALFAAVVVGFVLLVHGFAGTDPFHLWRYAFGFSVALTIVLVIEVGADDERAIQLVPLGRWLLLAALALQILLARGAIPKRAAAIAADLREARVVSRHGDPSARAELRRYTAMQTAIPAGASVAIMLDDPQYLDFSRNDLANLDTPGFASPGAQLPAFRGAEAMRAYLVDQGYRYVAFVRPDRSRYFYRREFWLWRLFNDSELFAAMSAYAIDTIESFVELATTTTVVFDEDGLVVLDLGTPLRSATTRDASGDEPTRRYAWTRELAEREKLHDAWSLTTRADVRFEDGIAGLQFVDDGVDDPAWFEIVRPRTLEPLRGKPIRALYRRAHLRVRGTTDKRLVIHAAIALNTVFTRPRLDVSLDGELLTSAIADDHGRYTIDLAVPKDRLGDGWHDLYLVFSSIAEPEKDVRDLRVARLELVEWMPLP